MKKLDEFLLVVYFNNFKTIHEPKPILNLFIKTSINCTGKQYKTDGSGDGYGDGSGSGYGDGSGDGYGDGSGDGYG